MPGDVWRLTDVVTVPDVVGPPLAHARNVAHDAGVVLAQPDSDGPPLGALSWPGEYLVTGQSPRPGTRLWRWDPVVVSWRPVDRGGDAGVAGTAASDTTPGRLRSAAPRRGPDLDRMTICVTAPSLTMGSVGYGLFGVGGAKVQPNGEVAGPGGRRRGWSAMRGPRRGRWCR